MNTTQPMLDSSPYTRPDVPPDHVSCPNCFTVVPQHDLQPIALGCIIRYLKRTESRYKDLLANGGKDADTGDEHTEGVMASLDTIFTDNTTWVNLPPVLKRLRCPVEELYTRKAVQVQKANICGACYETFVDDIEAAAAAKMRPPRMAPMGSGPGPKISQNNGPDFYKGRQSDRTKDMVFSRLQQNLRQHDRQVQHKRRARRKFVQDSKQTVDWEAVGLRSTAAKEARVSRGLTVPLPGALTTVPDPFDIKTPTRPLLLDDSRLPSMSAEAASSKQPVLRLGSASSIIHLGSDTGSDDGLIPKETIDVNSIIPDPPRASVFDVTIAQKLMYELLEAVGSECQFPLPQHPGEPEDVPRDHPFFTVYRQNSNRLPVPPVLPVALSFPTAEETDVLRPEIHEGVGTEDYTFAPEDPMCPGVDDLEGDELRLLMEIMADASLQGEEKPEGLIDGIDVVEEDGSYDSDGEEDEEWYEDEVV